MTTTTTATMFAIVSVVRKGSVIETLVSYTDERALSAFTANKSFRIIDEAEAKKCMHIGMDCKELKVSKSAERKAAYENAKAVRSAVHSAIVSGDLSSVDSRLLVGGVNMTFGKDGLRTTVKSASTFRKLIESEGFGTVICK